MKRRSELPLGLSFAGLLLIFGMIFYPLLILLIILPIAMFFDKGARKFAFGMVLIVPAAPIYLAVYHLIS